MREAPPEPTRLEVAKQKLLRIGSVVLGCGVFIALVAAVIGGNSPSTNVQPIRNAGGIVMVTGLVTLLAGYRLAWFRESWHRQRQRHLPHWIRGLPALSRFFFTVLPIVVGVLAVVWTTLFMVPSLLSAIGILTLAFLIPVVLAVVVVEGRGYQRAFCLGALFPCGVHMLLISLFFGGRILIEFRGRGILDVLDEIGESYIFTGFVWLFAVFSGLAAVGVRALLERLQLPPQRWRE